MKSLYLAIAVGLLMMAIPGTPHSGVTGPCVDCHTMHNSQGGEPMATYGTSSQNPEGEGSGPKTYLLRGTCFGCHAQVTGENIVTIGLSDIPQVFHADSDGDLAGGNFAYITGFKGNDPSDAKGHNVVSLSQYDGVLNDSPGDQHSTGVTDSNLTCAGENGCHGDRGEDNPYDAMHRAHHANDIVLKFGHIDENLQGASVGVSYRFLNGVKGGEHDEWQATEESDDHNEYKGATSPDGVDDTISWLCAECHGYYHGSGTDETGDESPWLRHPTDISLPGAGEYLDCVTYSTLVPVARVTIPDPPSDVVTPPGQDDDIVMCLSCHRAHASPYFKMMRWNYRDWPGVIDPPGNSGCATCHTWKD